MNLHEVRRLPAPAIVRGGFTGPLPDLIVWTGEFVQRVATWGAGEITDDDGPFTLVAGPVPPAAGMPGAETSASTDPTAQATFNCGWDACREAMGAT